MPLWNGDTSQYTRYSIAHGWWSPEENTSQPLFMWQSLDVERRGFAGDKGCSPYFPSSPAEPLLATSSLPAETGVRRESIALRQNAPHDSHVSKTGSADGSRESLGTQSLADAQGNGWRIEPMNSPSDFLMVVWSESKRPITRILIVVTQSVL